VLLLKLEKECAGQIWLDAISFGTSLPLAGQTGVLLNRPGTVF